MRRFALLAALALAACGAGNASDDDGNVDAGGNADAIGCVTAVSFEPVTPIAPAIITARSDVFGGSGIITYDWHVYKDGVEIDAPAIDQSGRDVRFTADTSGFYQVTLEVGSGCQPYFGGINVQQQGANTRAVRLRLVPPSSIAAPPQERIVTIPGGTSEYNVGVLSLDPGDVYPVAVRTPADAPVAAYLRFTSRATPDAVVESFSDAAGNADVRLVAGRYDVLVVPTTSALAPRVIPDWDPLLQTLGIDAGTPLDGSVLDAAGDPVEGARVSLTSGGVPSTVATTAADGSFSLRWREAATIEKVTVVPPAGSDLPRLDAQIEIGAMTSIVVRHESVATSDLGNTLVRVGGAPVPSTDVLVDLSLASAGTIRDGGGTNVLAQATGSHRTTLRTDASGRLPAARFVNGSGGVFIAASSPGATRAITLPLAGVIDADAPVTVSGRVLRAAGGARADTRVRATLAGPLAYPGAPIPTTTAGADGSFSLQLAAGAPYAIVLTDPTADDAAITLDIVSAATRDFGDLSLPAALSVLGEVRATGTSVGARAVGIAALCHLACEGLDRSRPLGDAVTDATGHFAVAVPDPGVTP
jgi:hypothetical protein